MEICVLLNVTTFWVVTPCDLVKKYETVEGIAASVCKAEAAFLSARLYGVTSEINSVSCRENVNYSFDNELVADFILNSFRVITYTQLHRSSNMQ